MIVITQLMNSLKIFSPGPKKMIGLKGRVDFFIYSHPLEHDINIS